MWSGIPRLQDCAKKICNLLEKTIVNMHIGAKMRRKRKICAKFSKLQLLFTSISCLFIRQKAKKQNKQLQNKLVRKK